MAVSPNTALTDTPATTEEQIQQEKPPVLSKWLDGGTSADECKETSPFLFFSLLTLSRDQPICRTVLLRQLSRDVNHKWKPTTLVQKGLIVWKVWRVSPTFFSVSIFLPFWSWSSPLQFCRTVWQEKRLENPIFLNRGMWKRPLGNWKVEKKCQREERLGNDLQTVKNIRVHPRTQSVWNRDKESWQRIRELNYHINHQLAQTKPSGMLAELTQTTHQRPWTLNWCWNCYPQNVRQNLQSKPRSGWLPAKK